MRIFKKNKTPLRPEPGAWEPMMLVVALAAAAALTFWIYGDRMPLAARDQAAALPTQQASAPPLPRT